MDTKSADDKLYAYRADSTNLTHLIETRTLYIFIRDHGGIHDWGC